LELDAWDFFGVWKILHAIKLQGEIVAEHICGFPVHRNRRATQQGGGCRSALDKRSFHFKAEGLADGRMDLTPPTPWQNQLPEKWLRGKQVNALGQTE
jgi:hypothetical protein